MYIYIYIYIYIYTYIDVYIHVHCMYIYIVRRTLSFLLSALMRAQAVARSSWIGLSCSFGQRFSQPECSLSPSICSSARVSACLLLSPSACGSLIAVKYEFHD